MRIVIAIGTRPELIKVAPVIFEIKKRQSNGSNIEVIVLSTGQHRQMLSQVFEFFKLKPDYDMALMKDNQSLFDITTGILDKSYNLLKELRPDLVLVHGDTSTTFSVALACYYLKIPIGHIEAGLRTYDILNPYPEEFNREAVSIISDYNFCPTAFAAENLLREGRKKDTVYITGNTIIDAMKYTVSGDYTHDELDWAKDSRLIFITAHRRENIGEPMHQMFRAIRRVLESHSDVKAIYPIHLNPTVREIADIELKGCERLHIIEPLSVFDCHNFEANSYLCLTDSGGIQEECPSFGVPVLVMRKMTERTEGVDAGVLKLVGTEEEDIYNAFCELLDDERSYEKMSRPCNPYGDGKASERIVNIIEGKEYEPWE